MYPNFLWKIYEHNFNNEDLTIFFLYLRYIFALNIYLS